MDTQEYNYQGYITTNIDNLKTGILTSTATIADSYISLESLKEYDKKIKQYIQEQVNESPQRKYIIMFNGE